MINRILAAWTRIEAVLIGLLLLAALVVFLGGAALRTLAPLHSVDWAEEVALYGIIWATALAGASLVAEGRHINTEVFLSMLPPSLRVVIGWAMTVLSVGFCVAMMVYGWQAFEFALLLDERSASSLRVEQGWAVFLALPVGMALIIGRVGLMLVAGQRPFAGDGASHQSPQR
jgi:TRAP-type C4-dicarboxylate transport system permease small subunit